MSSESDPARLQPRPERRPVDGVYYLVTSTFEYLPGMPVYRSVDLEDWSLIGHVATREEQIGIRHSPTPGGVFAPTIRFHDGRFYVIVSVMFNARGCVVFTAESPGGPLVGRRRDSRGRRDRSRSRLG